MRELLETHGYTEYLYAKGKPVILNNGIEFSAIYFVMLLSLFFTGGGRYVSLDYWLTRKVSNSFLLIKINDKLGFSAPIIKGRRT